MARMTRRDFLKATAAGAIVVGSGAGGLVLAPPRRISALELPAPMTREKSIFNVNGKLYNVEYEARTTLFEVLSERLGLTGTVRSCNRATCGACSVLIDGVPIYSCHMLATEAAGKKLFTVEGMSDGEKVHPLQEVGYRYMAAECGYCTAGWLVVAKGLLDKNKNPRPEQVKDALAGHLCRCGAYRAIEKTVIDSARVLRGEAIL
jgi:aerobic-type carbon monoxide dehydrogenase small subunit (CoxS/CutS family)